MFDDIKQLKFDVSTRQEQAQRDTLVNIMEYLPKRKTPYSSFAKSSVTGSKLGKGSVVKIGTGG